MSANSKHSSSDENEARDISIQDVSSSSAASSNDVQLHGRSPTPPSFRQESTDDHQSTHSPRTPSTPTFDSPLLSQDGHGRTPSRSLSNHFVSSPLNPNTPSPPFQRSRPQSRLSMSFNRVASEESQVLASQFASLHSGQRGSMVLYRFAGQDDHRRPLLPPRNVFQNRDSFLSTSRDSEFSLSHDSKYPVTSFALNQRGLIPYAYDPSDEKDVEEDDPIHDLDEKRSVASSGIALRGLLNVGVLVVLIGGLLSLFIAYPIVSYVHDLERSEAITGNTLVNESGQVATTGAFWMPTLIDPTTPKSALTRTGFDSLDYDLVFSDEFNTDNRTFWPGDDPFWEAANLWYWTTGDEEWYDPSQITTKNGYLSIVMDAVQDHGLPYRSGMLQSWNKFCFTAGYIEVSISLPGPNQETMGYWPGAWTMGNLARAGYGATTDGVWPYSYDACDVGTFPNQTLPDGSGPAAALHSDASRSKYNYELSWLPGQRLSSCTCPGEDHPGPSPNIGRGAPEIDILEVEHNKLGSGQVVSQSAQFAPFTHDYLFLNDTQEEWEIYTPSLTTLNSYRCVVLLGQQAVSALTVLPDDIFQESGAQFTTFGFEYWSDPTNPSDGYITWQTAGVPAARLGAAAMGPDAGTNGTGVSQRLISVEPMSIVLNLGISPNWQTINTSSMIFPAEMRVDYVRVYQRRGQHNVGCSPEGFPTEEYIAKHMDAYMNPNLTTWNYPKPRNSLVCLLPPLFFSGPHVLNWRWRQYEGGC
ncbi:beta-glucan synthesis-associated [Phlebopus sp. FC_14]|nr:beta-glucan synthesis-associated [Phlebopus sp. FC_14]